MSRSVTSAFSLKRIDVTKLEKREARMEGEKQACKRMADEEATDSPSERDWTTRLREEV